MPNQAITALLEILRPEIGLSKRRLETLCLIIVGMDSARSRQRTEAGPRAP